MYIVKPQYGEEIQFGSFSSALSTARELVDVVSKVRILKDKQEIYYLYIPLCSGRVVEKGIIRNEREVEKRFVKSVSFG